ncbi:MAG: response regulator [Chloroflexi bacterium]|nr:response regulator [Chloroflexota bacterium]
MANGRILVVEDDVDISNMLQIYFKSQGYDVAVAPSGEDALDVCRQELPHIVVLDIMLPDMDGYEVCRRLRSNLRTSHIPIIFLTQKDERADKIQGLELGADDYITKPFDVEELKLRVKNALSRSKYESLTNPVTGLPSGELIEDQMRRLMRRDGWGLIYIGIPGLPAFRDAYGFVAGDDVIRFTGMILGRAVDSLGTPEDFIGHIGSDEFVVITDAARLPVIAESIQASFRADVGTHYDWRTRERGYLLVRNDAGEEVQAELMRLSLGLLTSDDGPFADIREITEAAASARRDRGTR